LVNPGFNPEDVDVNIPFHPTMPSGSPYPTRPTQPYPPRPPQPYPPQPYPPRPMQPYPPQPYPPRPMPFQGGQSPGLPGLPGFPGSNLPGM